MAILSRRAAQFDEEDVKRLDEMLKKFYKLRGASDFPDNYMGYVAYLPVLSLALLGSQKKLEKLTYALIGLTVVLAILASVSIWAIIR